MTAELVNHFEQMIYDERWLPVPGFESAYAISNFGRVRSLDRLVVGSNGYRYRVRGRLRRICIDQRDGLAYVGLATGRRGHYRQLYIHKLVEAVFGDTETQAAA